MTVWLYLWNCVQVVYIQSVRLYVCDIFCLRLNLAVFLTGETVTIFIAWTSRLLRI